MAQWFCGLPVGRTLARAGRLFQSRPDSFLRQTTGVIHVGAGYRPGAETLRTARSACRPDKEPIPEVFEELERSLRDFPTQKAYRYLVTDRDDQDYDFHVANNSGESSSIFDLRLHRDVWPTVNFKAQYRFAKHYTHDADPPGSTLNSTSSMHWCWILKAPSCSS